MAKEPKILSFDEFADELMAETQPRALVILASARIDTQLRSLLEGFLLPSNGGLGKSDDLLDGENPLATFSSRIKICRRVGLIDDDFANALDKFRGIRNQAAHWVSFEIEEAPLRDQIRHLYSLMENRRSFRLTVARFFGEGQLSPYEQLQATFLTLSVLIESMKAKLDSKSSLRIAKPKKVN